MKREELLKRRERLSAKLPNPVEAVRGSLIRRQIRHSKGCPKCEQGGGHPVWVLSISYPGGKNKQISLRADQRRQAEVWTRNYKKLKAGLEAISEINHELLRLKE